MIASARITALIFAFGTLCAGPASAADDPALLKDLTAVITLLGMPCGQVVSARPLADKGHIASCKDGKRYRIFVNAEGRVVAQRQ